MREVSPQEVHADLQTANAPVLLDVRETWEYEICHIGAALSVPMNTIPARLGELDPERPVVVICHHGARSAQVGAFLERNGFADVRNLTGGVAAWARTVDPSMRTY